jgi:predicted AAA+ superfamily ATPase
MKRVALVAIFMLAGCAASSTDDSDSRLAHLEKKSREIAESEKRCVDEASTRSRDEMVRMAGTPGASVELLTQRETDERDREISQCHACADQENAEIAEQERQEYELQAEQDRNRASHIAILTTVGLH